MLVWLTWLRKKVHARLPNIGTRRQVYYWYLLSTLANRLYLVSSFNSATNVACRSLLTTSFPFIEYRQKFCMLFWNGIAPTAVLPSCEKRILSPNPWTNYLSGRPISLFPCDPRIERDTSLSFNDINAMHRSPPIASSELSWYIKTSQISIN